MATASLTTYNDLPHKTVYLVASYAEDAEELIALVHAKDALRGTFVRERLSFLPTDTRLSQDSIHLFHTITQEGMSPNHLFFLFHQTLLHLNTTPQRENTALRENIRLRLRDTVLKTRDLPIRLRTQIEKQILYRQNRCIFHEDWYRLEAQSSLTCCSAKSAYILYGGASPRNITAVNALTDITALAIKQLIDNNRTDIFTPLLQSSIEEELEGSWPRKDLIPFRVLVLYAAEQGRVDIVRAALTAPALHAALKNDAFKSRMPITIEMIREVSQRSRDTQAIEAIEVVVQEFKKMFEELEKSHKTSLAAS